jgi:MFS family permease
MWTRLGLNRGFDRDLWLLLGEMFSRRLVLGFLEVVRPIYLSLIGFSPIQVGLIMTAGMVVSAFDSLIFGSLSDRYGRKPFILVGSLTSTFRLVLYALSQDFWILIIAQGIGTIGEGVGAGQPIVSGYIADKTEVRDRPHVFSVLAISSALSTTIGALMAYLPANFQTNLRVDAVAAHVLLFWMGVVLNGVSVAFALPIRESVTTRDHGPDASQAALPWKEVGKFSLIRATDGLGMGLVTQLLPLYFYLRFSAGAEDLAPFYALARFLAIPTYFLAPFLARKLGNVKSLIISRIVTGALIAVFAMASSFQLSIVLFVAYRLLFEFAMPMRQAFSAGIVQPHRTGTLLGISNSTRSFVQSLAPTITGYLFEFAFLSLPLFCSAILLALNGIQYHLFYARAEPPSRPRPGP